MTRRPEKLAEEVAEIARKFADEAAKVTRKRSCR